RPSIRVIEEDRLPPVAALHDMVREAGHNDARRSRHVRLLEKEGLSLIPAARHFKRQQETRRNRSIRPRRGGSPKIGTVPLFRTMGGGKEGLSLFSARASRPSRLIAIEQPLDRLVDRGGLARLAVVAPGLVFERG